MLAFALFLALANAATNYTNSTVTTSGTSSSLATITSSASLSSASCSPKGGFGALVGCDPGLVMYDPGSPVTRPCNGQDPLGNGVDPNGNWVNCNRSGSPIYTFNNDALSPWYEQVDSINSGLPSSIFDICQSRWSSSTEGWKRTAPITPASTLPATTITTPLTIRGSTLGAIQTVEAIVTISTTIKGVPTFTTTTTLTTSLDSGPFTWSAFTQYRYVSPFSFTAESPCCQRCTLFGGNVQVFYWPTTAPAGVANSTASSFLAANTTTAPSAVSTLVNSAGFTFVSPSIYVAFESLRAQDYCGPVGPTFAATTLAFEPSALSTSTGYHWDTAAYTLAQPEFYSRSMTFTQATFGDQECTDITESFYQGALGTSTFADYSSVPYINSLITASLFTPSGSSDLPHFTVTYNPCSPVLSVPKEVYTLFPSWKTCGLGISAFFDPPSVLTHGTGDSAFTTVPPAAPVNPVSTTQASAAQSPAPVIASVTTSKVDPAPTPTSTRGNDPPVQTPSSINSPPAKSSTTNNSPAQSPTTDNPPPQPSSVVNNPPSQSLSVANSPSAQAPPPEESPVQSSAANNPPASSPTSNNPPLQVLPPSNPVQTAPASSQAASSPVAITVGSSVVAAGPSSNFIVASQTLTPGGQIINSGTQYSLASNAGTLIIGGSSTQIIAPPATAAPLPPVITVGGSAVTADSSSAFVIASQTLTPGGQITNSGTILSLASNGGALVVGGSSTQIIAAPSPVITPVSSYLVGSQTLSPGGAAVTVSGTTYSLPPAGSSVVVNGATQPLSALLSTPNYVVGSQTLVAGAPAITISGTAVSLQPEGSSVVVGSKTEPLSVLLGSSTTSGQGLGGIIATLGGFGGPSLSTTASSSGQVRGSGSSNGTFTGAASMPRAGGGVWLLGVGVGLGLMFVGML